VQGERGNSDTVRHTRHIHSIRQLNAQYLEMAMSKRLQIRGGLIPGDILSS